MTTLREARIQAVIKAMVDTGWVGEFEAPYVAEEVVNALFTPNPHLDNMQVPVKVQIEG